VRPFYVTGAYTPMSGVARGFGRSGATIESEGGKSDRKGRADRTNVERNGEQALVPRNGLTVLK